MQTKARRAGAAGGWCVCRWDGLRIPLYQQPKQHEPLRGATQVPQKPSIPVEQLRALLTDQLQNKLATTPAKALAPPFASVIFARTNDSVSYVFQKLIDCGILSMPVLDVDTNNFVAFVDMLDILSWVVSIGKFPTDPTSLYKEWQRRVKLFETAPCSELLQRTHRHPWLTLTRDLPIQKAIDFMVQHHANRIGLVESNGTFSSILTQHRIIKWFAGMDSNDLGHQLSMATIGQLGIGFRPVVTIGNSQPVFEAFIAMHSQRVSGVAVTDAAGVFIGNISVSDLKDIGHVGQNYEKLFMTCGNFLAAKSEGLGVPQTLYATRNSSLKEVLGKFKSFFVHRVYIVEKGSHKLEGVITPSDVLQLFARFPQTVSAQPARTQTQQAMTGTQQPSTVSTFRPSEAEMLSAMMELERLGGLLPLMVDFAMFPEASPFLGPEYGAGPTDIEISVFQTRPFFGTYAPQQPSIFRQEPAKPARIDITEDVKITQKVPHVHATQASSSSQQHA